MDSKTHDVEIGVKNDLMGVKSWKSTFTLWISLVISDGDEHSIIHDASVEDGHSIHHL